MNTSKLIKKITFLSRNVAIIETDIDTYKMKLNSWTYDECSGNEIKLYRKETFDFILKFDYYSHIVTDQISSHINDIDKLTPCQKTFLFKEKFIDLFQRVIIVNELWKIRLYIDKKINN